MSLRFVAHRLPVLVEHLLQYPVPNDMLPIRFPRALQNSNSGNGNGSWWERLPKNGASTYIFDAPMGRDFPFSSGSPVRWTENTFKNCIVATEICYLGLVLMQRTNMPPTNITALARGLYCTMFAAGNIGARNAELTTLNNLMDAEDGGNVELEKHFVRLLANNLSRCAAEALTVSLSLTDGTETDERIAAAVSSTVTAVAVFPSETRDYVSALCSELNK